MLRDRTKISNTQLSIPFTFNAFKNRVDPDQVALTRAS